MTNGEVYAELGENYRKTLTWRDSLFAGFLGILGLFAVAYYNVFAYPYLTWILTTSGSILAFIFFALDRRCHEILIGTYQLGAVLESQARRDGYYSRARQRGHDPEQLTHTFVLNALYTGTAFVLLIRSVFVESGLLQFITVIVSSWWTIFHFRAMQHRDFDRAWPRSWPNWSKQLGVSVPALGFLLLVIFVFWHVGSNIISDVKAVPNCLSTGLNAKAWACMFPAELELDARMKKIIQEVIKNESINNRDREALKRWLEKNPSA